MKILLAIKALGNPGGGAERVLAQIASGLADRGHDVTVISSDAAGVSPFYPVSDKVRLLRLGIGNVAGSSGAIDLCKRMLAFRRVILDLSPDGVVGFMHPTYLPVGLALLGSSIPVIASEHTSPEHYRGRPTQRLLLQLTPLICKRILVVAEQIRQSFGWWLRRKMVVLPNPVTVQPTSRLESPGSGNRKILLSVGRLGPEKGHAILLTAFSSITERFPEWTLRIVGDGELRPALEYQIESLGLIGKVELVGAKSDVNTEYAAADMFVLPSSYESFGLATAEALLAGMPAIGFADCPGTNTLIRDGENGRLVDGRDRTGALAEVLAELMGNPNERQRLADSSREWIRHSFGINEVLDRWESVLESVGK